MPIARILGLLSAVVLATVLVDALAQEPAAISTDDPVPAEPSLRWFKGNLHTHTLWSDGDDFPEMSSEWYRRRGYHFLAITDHNTLAQGVKWMKASEVVSRGGKDALEKYRKRFGGDWVETRGAEADGKLEIRLKPMSEYRALVEERGRFLLFEAEEISDSAEGKPIHLNAANIAEAIQPLGGRTVVEAIAANVRAVDEQSKKTGRETMVHLNHPNYHFAVRAEELAEVVSERFFEVYNGHPGVNHLGDDKHPSVERLWDVAQTIRVGELKAPALLGVATDDTHDYHGEGGSRPGRGWVMVQAQYLTPERIIQALKAGRFYASSGVSLKSVEFQNDELAIEIDAQPGVSYVVEFIGTKVADVKPRDENKPETPAPKYGPEIGQVLSRVEGTSAKYKLKGDELYVRATITASMPPADPSFQDQKAQAWTQPVGWEKRVESR